MQHHLWSDMKTGRRVELIQSSSKMVVFHFGDKTVMMSNPTAETAACYYSIVFYSEITGQSNLGVYS